MSLDATGFYSSEKLGSAACLIKTDKKTGTVTYQLQMLGAALVHPDQREVLPLFPEGSPGRARAEPGGFPMD